MATKKSAYVRHGVKTHNRIVKTKNGTKSVTVNTHQRKNPK